MKLNILDELPAGFFDARTYEAYQLFEGPTLIRLKGELEEPLFISTLLHGNEVSGFYGLQKLLKEHGTHNLPRTLYIFIGNVEAAKYGQRHLDGQADLNRVWTGQGRPEHDLAQSLLSEVTKTSLFAAIDIHNNTGRNPHYACINKLEPRFFNLAKLFSDITVYFTDPDTILTMALADYCPAVTLECGRSGDPEGIEYAYKFLKTCLDLKEISYETSETIDYYEVLAKIHIPPEVTFAIGSHEGDMHIELGLDQLNFNYVPAGTIWGTRNQGSKAELSVEDKNGKNIGENYFSYEKDQIKSTRPLIPSMITMDKKVIQQDCLGYIMTKRLYSSPSI